MEDLNEDDGAGAVGHEGVHGETGGMAENADDHGGAPTEVFQGGSEDEHGEDFGDLADAHDRGDPRGGDADATVSLGGAQEGAGPVEVAVVDEGIDEGDEPQHEHEGLLQEFDSLHPSLTAFGTGDCFLRRCVGQQEAKSGQNQRGNTGYDEGPLGGGLGGIAGQGIAEHGLDPFHDSFGMGGIDGVPVDENESEGPGGEDPADGAAHTNDTKLLGGVLHVGEGDGVGDGDGGYVQEAVHQHQHEERGKVFGEAASQDRQATDEVGEGEEFFGRELAVRPFIAEEHAHNGGDGEGVEDP